MMTIEEMVQVKNDRGYSFALLSKYSGVPVITLQKIFSGATKKPRAMTLAAIEKVLLGKESQYPGKYYFSWEADLTAGQVLKEPEFVYGSSARKPIGFRVEESMQGFYSVEDYRQIPDDKRYELIDGFLYEMEAPSFVHQDVLSYISFRFNSYIHAHHGRCKVLFAPLDVQLDQDDRTMLQPDLVVVCDPEKMVRGGVFGAPDFVLEVLSPSTKEKDMIIKRRKYQIAKVEEYWIIDPMKKLLYVHDFQADPFGRKVYELTGEAPVGIYGGELTIPLGEIAELIREYPEGKKSE